MLFSHTLSLFFCSCLISFLVIRPFCFSLPVCIYGPPVSPPSHPCMSPRLSGSFMFARFPVSVMVWYFLFYFGSNLSSVSCISF